MSKFKTIFILILGTFILSFIGLYNGYPLVYSDTGTYIYSGFDNFIPFDRPITYGLFIKFFSFGYSAWFVVLIQNLLTALVIYELLKVFDLKKDYFTKYYFLMLLFLVFFTGVGWYSNQLMPDFFAPLSILIIFVFLKGNNISAFSKSILALILVYSLVTHFSHLLIGSVLAISVLFLKIILKRRLKHLAFKKVIFIATLVFSGWVILPSVNYLVERKFILSKGSHVFLMAHLSETGILGKFLEENCSDPDFRDCKLCHYKDSLPADLASFIWGNNIVENTGGWEGSKYEYNKITKATLTRSGYLLLNIYRSFTYGLIQLTMNDIGQGLSAYNEGSAPYGQIHWRFRSELNNYLNSKQNRWNGATLKFNTLNFVHLLLIIVSVFILVILFSSPVLSKIDFSTLLFLFYTLISIFINSFITAGLNAPCERFQARVVWLLPFALLILIIKNYNVLHGVIFKAPKMV